MIFKDIRIREDVIDLINKMRDDIIKMFDNDLFDGDQTQLQKDIQKKINEYFDNLIKSLRLQEIKKL